MNGSKGTDVKELQELLMRLGYDVGSTGADGKFGKNTEAGVIAFQKKNRLTADGKYGEKTHAALMAVVGETDSDGEEDEPETEKTAQRTVTVSAESGSISVRYGNGVKYESITSVSAGMELLFVAMAENGWCAVAIGDKVGWISGEYVLVG